MSEQTGRCWRPVRGRWTGLLAPLRDAEHERKTVAYIEKNPTKAKLVRSPEEWPWTSARYRDKWGKLQL